MLGNVITSPTFRFLKVNDVDIEDIDISVPSWDGKQIVQNVTKLDTKFENVDFGVNKQLIRQNKDMSNSKIYLNLQDGQKEYIKYEFSNNQKILMDDIKLQSSSDSNSSVIIDYVNKEKSLSAYRNSVTYIYAEKNSQIDVYIITRQNSLDNISHSVGIITEENSQVNIYQVEIGFKFKAISVNSFLNGKGSKVNIEGIYLAKGEEKLDLLYNSTVIGENCKSFTSINGVQRDNSQKTFKGTIDFKRGCKGSVGDESEYITLLNDGIISKSLPILLCSEEDVRGNHAASAGKLNQEMLFYIMSRGLSLQKATNLVIMASLSKVIDKIPLDDIKQDIIYKIEKIITG